MARQNRRDIFSPGEVSVFHCIQRTVRRAWLCGVDALSGKSFEHRREWIQAKLEELAKSFGIDCLSFCVMSNHLDVILRNRPDVVETWSDDEVARRSTPPNLFGGTATDRLTRTSSASKLHRTCFGGITTRLLRSQSFSRMSCVH